jgi:hypothetical protein
MKTINPIHEPPKQVPETYRKKRQDIIHSASWDCSANTFRRAPISECEFHNINDIRRCLWVDLSKADYIEYDDKERGVPVYDDRLLFEFLTLESTHCGRDPLDIQDGVSYTSPYKKEGLIKLSKSL